MSNLETHPREVDVGPAAVATAERELLAPREVPLGGPRAMLVRRTLPHRDRRTVGAWCFVDHYGPDDTRGQAGMQVPPHPHTGLQTVSWLLDAEVLHHDSLGCEQLIRPGELNLMTAGQGISHSEQSPPQRSPLLHGVQLWVALPEEHRHQAPHFEHHGELPVWAVAGATATVLMGALDGVRSPAATYSPLLGADVALTSGAQTVLPLEAEFEHAVLATSGAPVVDDVPVEVGSLLYLGMGRRELPLAADVASRVMLLGGTPFQEQLLMWWNFVGRSHEEIAEAREQWEARSARFGTVSGYPGGRLAAPALPTTRLRPRGNRRSAP
jgi:redox-sensitive bicupin YhaK (pirin superfamily)